MTPQDDSVRPHGHGPSHHRGGRSTCPTIALLTPEVRGWHANAFLSAVAEAAHTHRVNLLYFVCDPLGADLPDPDSICGLIDRANVDGLIVSGTLAHGSSPEAVQRLCKRYADLPRVGGMLAVQGVPAVVADSYDGMRQAVEHLVVKHSYRRIAFIRGPSGHAEAEERFRAYVDVLQSHDIALDPALVEPGDYRQAGGRAAMERLLADKFRPEAVVAANDHMAIGALEVLQARGLRVPQDVAVVGFDDTTEAQYLSVSLTTVQQPFQALGRLAVEALLRRMQGEQLPERLTLPTKLVVRRSCGCRPIPVQKALFEDATPPAARLSSEALRTAAVTALVKASAGGGDTDGLHLTRPPVPESMLARLWAAFLTDLHSTVDAPDHFLRTFEQSLHQARSAGGDVAAWHGVVSVLRSHSLPYLMERRSLQRAESLLHQARVLASEAALRAQAYGRLLVEQKETQLQQLDQAMSAVIELDELAPIVTRHFPGLGIRRCYVVLQEPDGEDAQPSPERRCRWSLAWDERGVHAPAGAPTFPCASLFQEGTLPPGRRHTFVTVPLSSGTSQSGYALIEFGPPEWEIYARLREQIGGAVFRARLVQQHALARREVERLLLEAQQRAADLAVAHQAAEAARSQMQSALHETEGLFAAAQAILEGSELAEICHNLTVQFTNLVQADRVVIYLVDHERRKVVLSMCDGRLVGDEHEITYELLDEGISGLVFRTRQAVLSPHADDGIEPERTRERRRIGGVGSLFVVPLVARGRVIGTVTASNRVDQRQFTPHDVELMTALARQAATTIENVRLLAETERQVQRWESLSAVNQATSAQLDPGGLCDLLYREALRMMDLAEEKASFFVASCVPQQDELSLDVHYEYGVRLPRTSIKLGQSIGSWVVRHRRPLLLDDAVARQQEYGYELDLSSRERDGGRVARACIAVPLRVKDQVTGVMAVQSLDAGVFSEEHLALLSMWSGQVAVALNNAGLVETLRQHARELQARNEELDAFAHTVAHDLKNPLNAVLCSASVLVDSYASMPEEALVETFDIIARSSEKMNSITEELMLLSGVRKMDVRPVPLDMGTVVAEAQERLAGMIRDYRAQLILPERWPVALGYGPWIEEVWVNYVSNALKYGGRPPRVELGWDEGSSVRFWVRDNGPGIPPDKQGNLFAPFERLDQVRVKGYGLGLSIARRIVEKLDGQVGVDSTPDQGSTFWFTLPAAGGPGDKDLR